MSDVQTKLLDVALANKAAPAPQPVAPATIVQTSPVLEESVKQMSRVTTELQSSMDKKLDGVSALTSKVHEKVASQDDELAKLRAELLQMKEQSVKLNNELKTIKTETKNAAMTVARPAPAVTPVSEPVLAPAPNVAIAPVAEAVTAAVPAVPKAKTIQDPRFPPAVKEPPVKPADVNPPVPPAGMMATAIPLKTKNTGTIPWRVLIPE